ncbi:MAG: efflux RND transporter periplasmic adaptor subunit [Fimbriimonadaceae bacterium]|nr:efflux RND transporter periplasmic adaptor subunit [Fimbriimonadaceae bacterium]
MTKARRNAAIGTLLAVAVVWYFFGRSRGDAEGAGGEAAKPETAKVTRGEIRATVVATGSIEPETKVEVKANAGGEVMSLLVDVGDAVKAGDLIAMIDPEDSQTAVRTAAADLDAARANVAQASASAAYEASTAPARYQDAIEAVKLARARLRQAEQNYALARSTTAAEVVSAQASYAAAGARLSKAGTTRQIDTTVSGTDLVGAQQAQAEAASRVGQAQSSLELQQRTYETGLTRAKEARAAAEARLQSAKLQAETRPVTAGAQVREAEAALVSARERLTRLQATTLPAGAAQAQGDYEAAKVTLRNAQSDLKRQQELLEKGFVAQQAVETKQVDLAAAEGRFEVARRNWESLQTSQQADLNEARSAVAQSEAALQRARSSEREAGTAGYDVTAAQATLAQADADLEAAKAQAKQVDLRQQELAAARSALARAESSTRAAQARTATGDLRQRDEEEAAAAREQARAARSQAEANRRQVALRQDDVEAARAQLKQAEAALLQAAVLPLQVAERRSAVRGSQAAIARRSAELRNAQEQYADTIIRAPRNGVVIERFVEEGTIITSGRSSISEGTKIVTLADVTQLYCLAEVDESDVADVATGQAAELTVEAFPEAKFAATVRKVYPQGKVESDVTLFTVELAVAPSKTLLRPGMTAEIEILTAVRKDVLLVPAEAVKEGPKGFVVEVMRGETPTEVEVKTGIQSTDQIEVTDGLSEADEVVIAAAPSDEGDGGGKGDKQKDFNKSVMRGMKGMTGQGGMKGMPRSR